MNFKNLLGRKFGRLTVISFDQFKNRGAYWLCKCECGNTKSVKGSNLTSGNVKSCGCLRLEVLNTTTHGMSRTRLYNIYRSIIKRCELKSSKDFPRYGGRGITVFDGWKESFEAFRDWALSHGYRDDLTIDRIDVNGNYEPSNCRWVSSKQQAQNRRNNRLITFKGETLCLTEWARRLNCSHETLHSRLKNGWELERALTQPVRQLRKKVV